MSKAKRLSKADQHDKNVASIVTAALVAARTTNHPNMTELQLSLLVAAETLEHVTATSLRWNPLAARRPKAELSGTFAFPDGWEPELEIVEAAGKTIEVKSTSSGSGS